MQHIYDDVGFCGDPQTLSTFAQALFNRISCQLGVKGSIDLLRFQVKQIWAHTKDAAIWIPEGSLAGVFGCHEMALEVVSGADF